MNNKIFYFFSSILSPLLIFIFSSFLSKETDIVVFANYSLAMTYIAYFQIITDSGSKDFFLTNYGKKNTNETYFNNLLKINFIFILFLISLIYISDNDIGLILICLLPEFILFNIIMKSVLLSCQLSGDATKIKSFNFIYALSVNGFKIILFIISDNLYFAIITSGIVGIIVTAGYINKTKIIQLTNFLTPINSKKYTEFLKHYKKWLPFLVSSSAYLIYFNSDKLIISWFLSPYDLANYTISTFFISIGELACSIVWILLIPKASEISNDRRYQYNLKKIALLGGITFIVLTFIYGEKFIEICFNTIYKESYFLSVILSIYFIFRYFNIINELIILSSDNQAYTANARLICCLINITINLIFIKNFGVTVAAISTVISEMCLTIILINIVKYRCSSKQT